MSTAVGVWAVGAVLGLALTFGSIAHLFIMDAGPRELLRIAVRRVLISVAWPVAVPAYLVAAYRRDEW